MRDAAGYTVERAQVHVEDRLAQRARAARSKAQIGAVVVPLERERLQIAPTLSAAPDFPLDKLPKTMRDAILALEEHVQAPRSLCAHSVLSAAALVAQGLANIEIPGLAAPKPMSLFFLAVAVSGERKSACDDLALKAVSEFEAGLRSDYEEELRSYKAAKAACDAERRKIESDKGFQHDERRRRLLELVEPAEPLLPLVRAKEPNLEGLLNLLVRGRASVGVFTSEGGQFLGGHGMGDEAKTRTITGLSELWDTGSAQRLRAKEHALLFGRRVSISLAAQPKIASTLLADELARDQGFVGRFLVTMPESTIGTRQIRASKPLADQRLLDFHQRCRRLISASLPLKEGAANELAPPSLPLSEIAWKVWSGVAQSIENDSKPDGLWGPVCSAALKMGENIARIAGVLTLFEDPSAASRGALISGETMAAACDIGSYYLTEALRLSGHTILDPKTRALNDLTTWVTEKYQGEFINPRLIQRLAPTQLRGDADATRERVGKLCEFGVLEPVGRMTIDGQPCREAYRIIREGVER